MIKTSSSGARIGKQAEKRGRLLPKNLIKSSLLPDDLRTQAEFHTRRLRQMPVEPAVDQPEYRDHREGEQDEVHGDDGVGDERVEGPRCEIGRVVERVALLLEGREAREIDQRGGVEEED